jgi:TatD DNase family protein
MRADPKRSGEPPPAPEPLAAPALDSHCHIDLMDGDVDDVVVAARAVGIERIVQVGVDVPSSRWSADLAAGRDDIWAAVAIHPNESPAATPGDIDEIEKLATQPRVVAIGETGLDHYRTESDGWAAQEESFRRHIAIAKESGRALMIHDRDAHDDVLKVLAAEGAPPVVVFHSFSGDAEMAKKCVEAGYFMSFSGPVTYKNAGYLREAAQVAPTELMLVETDAPYLPPVPHRGKPNAPYLIPLTLRCLAEVKNVHPDQLCDTISANGITVFGEW